MICPQCGEELKANARFCSGCGLPFSASNTPAQTDPLLEKILDGKYLLLERLGAGGMGLVYRARREHIGDEVAVKVLHKHLVADAAMLERFRREARAAAQLRHPNIVSIIDLGDARGADAPAYIVMELIEGESLRELLHREQSLRAERAVSLMRDICAGVGAAHRKGIFHRDLKPDNMIVTGPDEDRERESVKVVDFGIAKLRDAAGGTTLTNTGMVLGTPYYMSPEQCRGEALDARADVYSLGAIMYELLAGAPPFTAETPTGLIARHLFDEVPPLPESANAPPALEAVIMRSLAKDRKARQPDATELGRELRAALQTSGATVPAPLREPSADSTPTEVLDADTVRKITEPTEQHLTEKLPEPAPETLPEQSMPAQLAQLVARRFGRRGAPRDDPQREVARKNVARRDPAERRRTALAFGALLILFLLSILVATFINRKSGDVSSGADPARELKNGFGIEFVRVPAGSFSMGSENGDTDEKPSHRVTISKDFYLGKYEVTQAQWMQVMDSNTSDNKNCEQCPVEQVSWDGAQKFIGRLNAKDDRYQYRLPTEAEWEYACRAGTTGDYAGKIDDLAWYAQNSGDKTHPVGTKQPNAWGLYDMHGNVWEWVADWYGTYPKEAVTDPTGPSSGTSRVYRGGAYNSNRRDSPDTYLRSTHRGISGPGGFEKYIGFRLVRTSK
ncbi:MAG: SUMF1/EgtB/PvdO family nonheme iron enzyme [Acidobacteria bacterium]|nr:SUMF1/EgtB/PvdO family nonheme iron enzyme [Acidobacteriota bacterium]